MIRPFVLRRLKSEVLSDLPEKLEENVYARLEGEQRALYDAHAQRMKELLSEKSDKEFRTEKLQILSELTKLRQLCCDPSLLFEGYQGGSAKLEMCMELLLNAVQGGHKILLFPSLLLCWIALGSGLRARGSAIICSREQSARSSGCRWWRALRRMMFLFFVFR